MLRTCSKPALARGTCGPSVQPRCRISKPSRRQGSRTPVPAGYVGEPNVEDTIAILRGLKGAIAGPSRRKDQDAAIVAAAAFNRYITDRFLPTTERSISSTRRRPSRIEIDSLPPGDRRARTRNRIQLEIERQALTRRRFEKSKSRLDDIEENRRPQ